MVIAYFQITFQKNFSLFRGPGAAAHKASSAVEVSDLVQASVFQSTSTTAATNALGIEILGISICQWFGVQTPRD